MSESATLLAALDEKIAAAEETLRTLRDARTALLRQIENDRLDAHLARLRPEVLVALREPAPRAKDMNLLKHHRLAYSNGGSSREWTRDLGRPLRQRLLERDANPNPRNDP